jgi:RNA polymerase sigma-B factor
LSSETELLHRYAETSDPTLKEELVRRFLPLARSLALRYRGSSEDIEDLIQVASLGLVKALDGFDPERGKSFIAYAAPTILGELRRHFRDRVWEVRLPRGLQERTMAVSEAAAQLGDELGATPTVSQIAKRLQWEEDEVSEALQADEARRTLSLEVPRNREDVGSSTILETLGEPEPGYDAVEAQLAAEGAPLDERERRVLSLRFEQDLNQYEIGRRLGGAGRSLPPSPARLSYCSARVSWRGSSMSPLEVTAEQHPGQTRIVLIGELDIASADGLEKRLADVEADSPAILVLDLRRVEFIDSTGLRSLIAADQRARSQGRRLAVVSGPNAVARLLTVTQLDQRLEIVDDPDAVSA